MVDPAMPLVPPSVDVVRTRMASINDRIEAAGGDLEKLTLIAVTKAFPFTYVSTAIEAGLVDLGENYAQELVAKADGFVGYGMILFDGDRQKAYKCDLCGGRPQCVKVCPMNALGIAYFEKEVSK